LDEESPNIMLKSRIQILVIIFLSLSLIACDGLDFESIDATPDELNFSSAELNKGILFSQLLLRNSGTNDTRDGFIALFKSASALDEIEFRSADTDGRILIGDYAWDIVNERLQVSYPNNVICTSRKTSESGSELNVTATCDNGDPANDRIQGNLRKPVTFNNNSLATRTVVIDSDDSGEKIEFMSNGNFEITQLDTLGNEIPSTTESGTYNNASNLNNVVRVDNMDENSDEYRLLILLDGNLTSGTILELNYIESSNLLDEARIYIIKADNRWGTNSFYSNIFTDN